MPTHAAGPAGRTSSAERIIAAPARSRKEENDGIQIDYPRTAQRLASAVSQLRRGVIIAREQAHKLTTDIRQGRFPSPTGRAAIHVGFTSKRPASHRPRDYQRYGRHEALGCLISATRSRSAADVVIMTAVRNGAAFGSRCRRRQKAQTPEADVRPDRAGEAARPPPIAQPRPGRPRRICTRYLRGPSGHGSQNAENRTRTKQWCKPAKQQFCAETWLFTKLLRHYHRKNAISFEDRQRAHIPPSEKSPEGIIRRPTVVSNYAEDHLTIPMLPRMGSVLH